MYELWMQVPSEYRIGYGVDKWVGQVESYSRAFEIAQNLITLTGYNVWVEEV